MPGNEFSMRADCKMPRLDPHHIVKSELENETTFRAHLLNKTLLFFFLIKLFFFAFFLDLPLCTWVCRVE